MWRLPIVAVLVAGCAAGATRPPAGSIVGSPGAMEPNATVESTVDGDTIDVRIGGRTTRVRLIGIDTPEVAHPAGPGRPAVAAECFGDEAARFTASMVPSGTPVRLERDVVPRDDYGRLLAYVYRAGDGVFVNFELARHGFAQTLTIAPNTRFHDVLVEATRQAEADGAGLWAACRHH